MNFFRVAGVVASMTMGVPSMVAAQPGGPYAPLILTLPAGARPLAMGNVGVAGRDDDVLFYNPAQLAIARGTSGSVERYSGTSAGGTLSSVTRLTNSAIGIGVRVVDYKTPESFLCVPSGASAGCTPAVSFPLDRGSSLGSGRADGLSAEATLGYAMTLKGLRIGAAAKYVEDEVPAVRVQRATFDFGLAKDFFRNYTLALAIQNIGKSSPISCMEHSEIGHENCLVEAEPAPIGPLIVPLYLPLRTTLGASTTQQVGEFDLVATAAVSVLKKNSVNPAAGAELGYSWLDGYSIALRGGVRRSLPGEGPVTGGAGVTMDRLSIDYAIEMLAGSRVAHRVGFRIR